MKQKGFLLAAGVSLAMAFTFSCSGDDGSDGKNGIDGEQGLQGANGASCDVSSVAEGTKITCGESVVIIPNAVNGTDGTNGTNGTDGIDGKNCEAEQGDNGVITITCGESTIGIAFCGSNEYSFYNPLIQECQGGFVKYTEEALLKDTRDGKIYRYAEIGDQTWMAENLNYETESGSACYRDAVSNCAIYGKLYDWSTAVTACPSGWHLPTNEDWDKLLRYVDGNTETSSPYESSTAGSYLKSASGWNDDGNGEDTYGFAALPGGDGSSDGSFYSVGYYGLWWSASENNASSTYRRYMSYNDEYAYYDYSNKSNLFSVRCLQDVRQ